MVAGEAKVPMGGKVMTEKLPPNQKLTQSGNQVSNRRIIDGGVMIFVSTMIQSAALLAAEVKVTYIHIKIHKSYITFTYY